MTFFQGGVDVNRDKNKDDLYVVLQTVGTPGVRGGSGAVFVEEGARIAIPAPILGATADGTWQTIADLTTVEENTGLTAGVADLTVATTGYYVIGADIDVTQSVLYDGELAYRVNINAGAKLLQEDIAIYEVDTLQNEETKTLCYLEAGDVLTLEYKASLDVLDINYAGLFCYSAGSSGAGGGPVDLTPLEQRWAVNKETIVANKTLVSTDAGFQNLRSDTAGPLDIILPVAPLQNQYFAVLNQTASSENITLDSAGLNILLTPGDTAEVLYDNANTEWIVL